MIEQELILLGLLNESPKHGYEIKLKIKEILSLFAGVDLKSIYYPLRVLEKRGLLLKRTAKQGRRPKRYVYELTSKGKARFQELLNKNLLDFKRPQFSLDLSLYFLHYVKSNIAKRRLQARMHILKNIGQDLRRMINSLKGNKNSSLIHILEHNLQMVDSESEFLANFTKTL